MDDDADATALLRWVATEAWLQGQAREIAQQQASRSTRSRTYRKVQDTWGESHEVDERGWSKPEEEGCVRFWVHGRMR